MWWQKGIWIPGIVTCVECLWHGLVPSRVTRVEFSEYLFDLFQCGNLEESALFRMVAIDGVTIVHKVTFRITINPIRSECKPPILGPDRLKGL